MKIVVNRCYGGFGLSAKAIKKYLSLKGKDAFFYEHDRTNYSMAKKVDLDSDYSHCVTIDCGDYCSSEKLNNAGYFSTYNLDRTDKDLIKVVEELGEKANGRYARLKVVEIPDDIEWEIDDYDGVETIHEKHRSW